MPEQAEMQGALLHAGLRWLERLHEKAHWPLPAEEVRRRGRGLLTAMEAERQDPDERALRRTSLGELRQATMR